MLLELERQMMEEAEKPKNIERDQRRGYSRHCGG